MSQWSGKSPDSGARPGVGRGRKLFRLRHRHRTVMLGQGAITIGRRVSCDLVLNDMQVSREHARIIVGEQSAAVEDLGSNNGVYVNGKPVRGMHQLRPGDQIGIGTDVIEVLGFAEANLSAQQEESEETNIGRRSLLAPAEDDHEQIPTIVSDPRKPR